MDELTKKVLRDQQKGQIARLVLTFPSFMISGYSALKLLTVERVLVSKQIDGVFFSMLLTITVVLLGFCLNQILTIMTLQRERNGDIENKKDRESSVVSLNDQNKIIWSTQNGSAITSFNVDDIRAIGESVFLNDRYYLYILEKGNIQQISAWAKGTDDVVSKLGRKLNVDLAPRLGSDMTMKTSILWPTEMAGERVLDYVPNQPTKLLERVKSKLGVLENKWVLTEDLKKHFG